MSMQEFISAWDRNKKFFGTSDQPTQISKMMDMIKEQDERVAELEEQIAELLLTIDDEVNIEEPIKKKK